MIGKPPCKDCPDRYPGCHASCEKYQSWLQLHIAEKRYTRQFCKLPYGYTTAGKERAVRKYLKTGFNPIGRK